MALKLDLLWLSQRTNRGEPLLAGTKELAGVTLGNLDPTGHISVLHNVIFGISLIPWGSKYINNTYFGAQRI